MEHDKSEIPEAGGALDGHIVIVIGTLKNSLKKTEQQRDDLLNLLVEIDSWLAFNPRPTLRQLKKMRTSIKQATTKAKIENEI